MVKENKSTAVPELRFPEFRDAWRLKPLAPYLQECSSKVSATTSLPIYSSSRAGLTPQSSYYDGRTIVNAGEYGVVPPECFVYRHMSDDGQFVFNLNETGSEIAVSKEYPVFRTVDLDPKFLLAKLNHSSDFKTFALSQKAGGTRTRLYFSKLRGWETFLPSLAEQQKIAHCLTSLDEVIAAQGRKVEALKAYKRGLMQQLFPREGETVPRLRFPEFQEEWNYTQLETLCFSISSGKDQKEADGVFDLYGSTEIIGKTLTPSYDGPHILIARVGANAGFLTKTSGRFGVTDNTLVISLKPSVNLDYIFYYLGNININKLIFDSGQPLITGSILKNLRTLVPVVSEQKKISTYLSSVDELIIAERNKLEALKIHKQSLIQQLFPSPEGVEV